MSSPRIHHLRLKKSRQHLSVDKKVVVERKSLFQELVSRLSMFMTKKKAPATNLQSKKRATVESNTQVSFNDIPANFNTDLISQYWYPNFFSAIAVIIFGHLYKYYVLSNSSETNFLFFMIKSTLILFILLVIVAVIYAFELRHNIVCQTSTERTTFKSSKEYWLTKNDALEVMERMPQWLSDPEMETANWFNALLARLWPLLQDHLSKKLNEVLGEKRRLDKYNPLNKFTHFRISTAELGKKVPCITGIHVMMYGVKREVIIVDADIIYNSDVDFRICGAFKLLAGLTNFYFRTTLRLTIGPLFRVKPTIGSVNITFLNTPTIGWKFIGIAKFLNASIFKSLVAKLLATFMKNPRCFPIRIAKIIPKRERHIGEPQGLLCVDIIEAKNLPRSQSNVCCRAKADAFCTVTVGDETKYTPVASVSDNPEWNRSFNFVYHRQKRDDIEVFVKDENFDQDEIIGGVVIEVQKIINELNGREFTIQLRDPNTGAHVYSHLNRETLLAIKIIYFDLSADIEKLKTWNLLTRSMPAAALSVLIDYATGLETASHQIQSPDLRPLVRVNVGNQSQVTSVKERSGAPLWDESLHFLIFSPKLEMIHIQVIDLYGLLDDIQQSAIGKTATGKLKEHQKNSLSSLAQKGSVLGYVTLPVADVLDAPKMKTEGFYQLEGFLEKAHIKVLMAMRITDCSKTVIENNNKTRTHYPESPDPPEKEPLSTVVNNNVEQQQQQQPPQIQPSETQVVAT